MNWLEAKEISEGMYTSVHSKLINGYAMDTAISFIYDEIDKYRLAQTTKISGTQSYKNIYDLVDDMFEWTSEAKLKLKFIRGSTVTNNNTTLLYFEERFGNEEEFFGEKLGFRTIIYR